jgi:hypothetical protein
MKLFSKTINIFWQTILQRISLRNTRSIPLVPCALSLVPCALCLVLFSCNYSFTDVSIPTDVKTVYVGSFPNKARYVNPQLSPQITERLKIKINNQTRLSNITSQTEAHYDITGWIADYSVTTSGVSNQQASINRLTVTVHIIFKDRLHEGDPTTDKSVETDVSRNFDFSANLSLNQAEAQLGDVIVKNMVDEIFNRVFSQW